jgi:hypothetical protein
VNARRWEAAVANGLWWGLLIAGALALMASLAGCSTPTHQEEPAVVLDRWPPTPATGGQWLVALRLPKDLVVIAASPHDWERLVPGILVHVTRTGARVQIRYGKEPPAREGADL